MRKKDRGRQRGTTLLEVVVAGAVLSVAFLAAHYSATLAWKAHLRAARSSEAALALWNRSSRFRATPEAEGSLLLLHPHLRPLQRVVLEEQGVRWEVIHAR